MSLSLALRAFKPPQAKSANDYTDRPSRGDHTCTFTELMHTLVQCSAPSSSNQCGGLPAGWHWSKATKTKHSILQRQQQQQKKSQLKITSSWQQSLGKKVRGEKDKLRHQSLMVSWEEKERSRNIRREWGWVIEKLSDGWDRSDSEMMIVWWMRRWENGEIKEDRWLDEWRQLDAASGTMFFVCVFYSKKTKTSVTIMI